MGRDISAQRGFVDACAVKKSKRDRKEGRRGAREESVGLRSHLGRFLQSSQRMRQQRAADETLMCSVKGVCRQKSLFVCRSKM